MFHSANFARVIPGGEGKGVTYLDMLREVFHPLQNTFNFEGLFCVIVRAVPGGKGVTFQVWQR